MPGKAYKNLNCKIRKSVLGKLEDTKLVKAAMVEKTLREYINKYNKTSKI